MATHPVTSAELSRLLERLRPARLADSLLLRAGPEGDGGWSLPSAAWGSDTVFAVGADRACSLRGDFAARGVQVYEALALPPALRAVPPSGRTLLTLDLDGAEWAALAAADATALERCATLAVAFHGLAGLVNRDTFDLADAVLQRLNLTHVLVHLRGRDTGGRVLLSQMPFPCVLETTWVRRRDARVAGLDPRPVPEHLAAAAGSAAAPQTAVPSHGFDLFPTLRALHLPAPQGVLQVGASYGQEMREFQAAGIRAGVFVEPLPEPFAHLSKVCQQIPNFHPVQALCSDRSGRVHDFHVASNGGMSSSILKPVNHLVVNDYVAFPTTVKLTSTTLDDLVASLQASGKGALVSSLDLLFMDTQGAEFKILTGATKTLPQFKYLYFEVMRNDMYEGQTPFLTYCHFLDALGFTLNDVYFHHPEQTGNALFVRKDLVAVQH